MTQTSHPIPTVSYRRVLTSFAASIASSWLASPLGVIALHLMGYGSEPSLVVLLLAISAAAPFQLLCNEYLASSVAKSGVAPSGAQIVTVLIAQYAATVAITVYYVGGRDGPPIVWSLLLSALLAISTWLSYRIAVRFYRIALQHKIRHSQSAVIGAIPGLATLAVYLVAGLSHAMYLLLVAAVAPAVVQWAYIHSLRGGYADDVGSQASVSWSILAVTIFCLGLAALANAFVRAQIGLLDQQFIALILTGLNLVGTMVLLVSRTSYLAGAGDQRRITAFLAGGFFILALAVGPFSRIAGLLVGFLSIQMVVAALIAHVRGLRPLHPIPLDARIDLDGARR